MPARETETAEVIHQKPIAISGYAIADYGGGFEDFLLDAGATLPKPWTATKTGSGTTAGNYAADAAGGHYVLALATDNEAETSRLDWGDQLCLPAGPGTYFEARIKIEADLTGAGGYLATSDALVCGLASASNATLDSVAVNAWFRVQGGGSQQNVLWESDDGTTDDDDNDTGVDYTDAAFLTLRVEIDDDGRAIFSVDLEDGRGPRKVGGGDLSAATGNLQPYVRLDKAAAANHDHKLTIDAVAWGFRR